MLLCELIDVLIVLVFYDFLFFFMLICCDGCIKVIVSFYCVGEEKFIEIYKVRVKVVEENKLFLLF